MTDMNLLPARLPVVCLLSAVAALFLTAVRAEDNHTFTNRESRLFSPGELTVRFTIQTNSVRWDQNHTALTFMCRVVVENLTHQPFTVTNLFQNQSGISLKVLDQHGTELSRLLAPPFHQASFTIGPGSNQVFFPYYGVTKRFTPGTNQMVRLQLEGGLSGNGYTKPLTSNIVDLKVP
jgi:hypothetical protein